jgi:hypothetical protein
MLEEHHVISSVRDFPRFHVTALGLGTYYPRTWGHCCILFIMRGPHFILVTHFAPKITLITFLNERLKISPLRSEGQISTHVTQGVGMIKTFPWHDYLHKTLHKKEHTTLATYHNANNLICSIPLCIWEILKKCTSIRYSPTQLFVR